MIVAGAIVIFLIAMALSPREREQKAIAEAKERTSIDADVLAEMVKIDKMYPELPQCEPEWAKEERLKAARVKEVEAAFEAQRREREAAVLAGMEAKAPGRGGRDDIAEYRSNTFECVMKDGTRVPWQSINLFGWAEALRRARSS